MYCEYAEARPICDRILANKAVNPDFVDALARVYKKYVICAFDEEGKYGQTVMLSNTMLE